MFPGPIEREHGPEIVKVEDGERTSVSNYRVILSRTVTLKFLKGHFKLFRKSH